LEKQLREKERKFVASVSQQILACPEEFALTEKQATWFRDIWARHSKDTSDGLVRRKVQDASK
jgi:hypothetical protein